MEKTICAICTPFGSAGLGVIRISGTDALQIAGKFFDKTLKPNVATVGTIKTPDFTEHAVVTYFAAPKSFTGEHTVELCCHGGWFLLNQILSFIIECGATLAQNGEFTKRAFVNGKLSLDQAESVIDIINAESISQINASNQILKGRLSEKLNLIQSELVSTLAQIEVTMDYPDEDMIAQTAQQITNQVKQQISSLQTLVDTNKQGKIISGGVEVCILGLPNAGKSSLFNALLSEDRAIITDQAGTTRDTLTESYNYKNIKFNLTDTAGVRETDNKVEKIGVERAKEKLSQSHIACVVLDASTPFSQDEKELFNLVNKMPHLIVLNKTDLKIEKNIDGIKISAITGAGVQKLKDQIFTAVVTNPPKQDSLIITNNRHLQLLQQALHSLSSAVQAGSQLELVSMDINEALNHIGSITGTYTSEDVIDKIFSSFCLGK